MNGHRDPEADDKLVDLYLSEELGGVRAPDFAARIAAATPDRLAAAGRTVDAAAAGSDSPSRSGRGHRVLPWLLAALLVLGLGAAWAAWGGGWPAATVEQRAQALIDEFLAAMPPSPSLLRDPERRRAVAARALPVIHRILADRDVVALRTGFGRGFREFEVYGVVLGDAGLEQDLVRRAAAGDTAAGAGLAIARMVLTEGAARARALAGLADLLGHQPELEAGFAQALVAADLSVAEAEQLAPAFADRTVAQGLVRSAELAAQAPARRLGQHIELYGRLADDTVFRPESVQGRAVLVCFWASWCRPSVREFDHIRRVGRRHPELAIVTVSCDHDPAALHAFLAGHGDASWFHLYDRMRPGWHELARAFGVQLLPTVMLLDRDGILRDVPEPGDLDAAIARLLGR